MAYKKFESRMGVPYDRDIDGTREEVKNTRLQIMVGEEEATAIRHAAYLSKTTVSAWGRHLLLQGVEQVIATRQAEAQKQAQWGQVDPKTLPVHMGGELPTLLDRLQAAERGILDTSPVTVPALRASRTGTPPAPIAPRPSRAKDPSIIADIDMDAPADPRRLSDYAPPDMTSLFADLAGENDTGDSDSDGDGNDEY